MAYILTVSLQRVDLGSKDPEVFTKAIVQKDLILDTTEDWKKIEAGTGRQVRKMYIECCADAAYARGATIRGFHKSQREL